ncbi:MAG: molybdopterin-dependent oxidoreductase [Anaerolineae bacterium]|nr:molybdopterin-dependent oxidoreductase [Anaerolineae bacterium]MDW8300242.1 molybdopterin-dependent oxidoreductase [Anaerolineae bacterium]
MSDKPLLPEPERSETCALSRRDFLKLSAATGGAAALLGSLPAFDQLLAAQRQALSGNSPLSAPERQIYTVCLQCNTGCGIKVKIWEGIASKIEGNPYSPWTLHPHLPYSTPVAEAGSIEGGLCPKGQAGLQTAYDPYRIVSVLKRRPGTKRGEGQWVTISFEQALDEIINGGDLFGEGPVEGLKDVYALRDAKVAKAMSDFVKRIVDEKDAEKKRALVEEFKATFAADLDKLIDPDHPDLGPKNNQFAFIWGRLKNGRGDLVRRFVLSGLGSINANGHTTVCQGSLYFAGKALSEQWDGSKFTGGQKFYWQADLKNSRFVIFIGANMFEANYGPPLRVTPITEGAVDRGLRYVVVDPRFSKVASKAWKWIPIKPGEDSALGLGMMRWMFENDRINKRFLSAANKAAANAIGEASWTDAVWLVHIKNGKPDKLVRALELGLVTRQTEQDKDGKEVTVYVTEDGVKFKFDPFVALVDGKPTPVDPNSTELPVYGDLFVDTTLQNAKGETITVKSGLQIIRESAFEKTIEEYAAIADIQPSDIIELAREFTSYGTQAVIDIHRGASQHTNGFYTSFIFFTLNALIGNFDHKGGLSKPTTYDRLGSRAKGPFDLAKMNNGANVPFGLDILRTTISYEKSTIFNGYPAKRPWFPLATDVYQEDLPSIGDAYPYPVKIAMFYMSAINYALPAGHTTIEVLADPKKLPLIIASDIFVGETSMYADYIFPDLSYLERWEFHGTHPSVTYKVENVRNPAISLPGWPMVKVYGQEIPLSFEALVLGIAERLNLPGFGPNGLGEGVPFIYPEDYYLRMVANLAFGEKEDGSNSVPEADDREVEIFLKARAHLPKQVFDPVRWKAILGNDEKLWRQTIYVLNRGGRWQDEGKDYKGDLLSNAYAKQINLYQEKTAKTINSMTGEPFAGYPRYYPPHLSSTGKPIEDGDEYAFTLITYKEITMTKARTISNYWLLAVMPENTLLMNVADAQRLGLRNGDLVRISSASNPRGVWDLRNGSEVPMVGRLKVVQGIRPGVVAFGLGWGHWASGARDIVIDGQTVKGDVRRLAGFHANAAMRTDPVLQDVTLTDIAGGSAVFYSTKVKVEKA